MASNAYDFGLVERLQASAVGLPGQRTFRLQFQNDEGRSAALWLEKEQLQALGDAIDQLIAQLSNDQFVDLVNVNSPAEPEAIAEEFFPEPVVEFKIGRLALGYDESRSRFTLLVHDIEADQTGAASFRCMVTKEQLQRLSEQVDVVIAAGRPVCPLCGAPLETGVAHFCPPSNGHASTQEEQGEV